MADRELAHDNYALYRWYREQGHDHFLIRGEEALRFYVCDHWTPEERSEMLATRRPALTLSEYTRTVNAVLGEMQMSPVDVRFDAVTGDESTAVAINKLFAHTERQSRGYMHDLRVRRDGLLLGRGYYDVRATFDNNMRGHCVINSLRPQNVILNPDIDSPDPSKWPDVTVIDLASYNDIAKTWGDDAANELDLEGSPHWLEPEDRYLSHMMRGTSLGSRESTPDIGRKSARNKRVISRQYREMAMRQVFVDPETGDTSEVPESWDRAKIVMVREKFGLEVVRMKRDTIKWLVSCDSLVLHNDFSPYKHFTVVPYFPYFVDGHTMSLHDILVDPQRMLNKVISQEVAIINSSANSGYKVVEGQLKNMTVEELEERGSENGLVMVVENQDSVEKIQPNNPPAGHDALGQKAMKMIRDLGGATDAMLGDADPGQSGKAMKGALTRGLVNLALPNTMFYFAKELVAERALDCFQSYYTDTRVLKIARGYRAPEILEINSPTEDGTILHDVTLGEYAIRTLPATSRIAAEERAFDQMVELKQLGVTVPNSVLIECSAVMQKMDVVDQLLAANSGDVSPEEERARAIEMQRLEIELQDAVAGVEAKQAQKILSLARAKRAVLDSEVNPHKVRAALETRRQDIDASLQARKIDQADRKRQTDAALKLTEMQQQGQVAAQAAAEKAKPQTKQPPKRK